MSIFLKNLELKNFRGIGEQAAEMPKFGKINLFIGENNTGKSTILIFICNYLGRLDKSAKIMTDASKNLDTPTKNTNSLIEFSTYIDIEKNEAFISLLEDKLKTTGGIEFIEKILSHNNDQIKLNIKINKDGIVHPYILSRTGDMIDTNALKNYQKCMSYVAQALGSHIKPITNPNETFSGIVDLYLEKYIKSLPNVKMIPTIRSIDKDSQTSTDYSGKGLISLLARLDRPNIHNSDDQLKFAKIQIFLREVISNQNATIEIPDDKSAIIVTINGKRLPLENLGTGISEVIMIATFCTLSVNEVICIEEPETHLHPILQKKLIRYLNDETSNQYFIATHSASFIDTPNAAIFHVYLENNQTMIKEAILNSDRYNICHQLGYKASDILQANSVVWVEGPSELIYLRYWIECIDPSLIEGIHYSVMFYGGRLLSHLSGNGEEGEKGEEEDVKKFIQLPSLNRNSLIVMDSDKKNDDDKINDTKERIKIEFETNGGYVWITQGREIENYLNYNDIQAALKENHPRIYEGPDKDGQYDHAFYFKRTPKAGEMEGSIEEKADKVSIAKWIENNNKKSFGQLDLNNRVYEVVNFIRKANGLEEIEMKSPTDD